LRRRRLMAAGVLLLFAVGSLVDYPVRVPSVMVVVAFAFATLWIEREPQSGQPNPASGTTRGSRNARGRWANH